MSARRPISLRFLSDRPAVKPAAVLVAVALVAGVFGLVLPTIAHASLAPHAVPEAAATAPLAVHATSGTLPTLPYVGAVTAGDGPWGIVVDPSTNLAYVTNAANSPDATVSVDNLATQTELLNFPVTGPGEPRGSWYDPSTGDIWVPTLQSSVEVFDASTGTLLENIPVGNGVSEAAPYSIAFDPQTNQVWVTDFFNSEITAIDRSTFQVVTNVSTGAGSWPYYIALDPSTQLAFVTDTGENEVHVVNVSTDQLVASLPVADLIYQTDQVNPTTHEVFVSGSQGNVLTVIQENPLQVLGTFSTAGDPFGTAIDAADNLLAVTGWAGNGTGDVYCLSNLTAVAQLPPISGIMGIAFDPTLQELAITDGYMTYPDSGVDLFSTAGAIAACSGSSPPPENLGVTASLTPTSGTVPLDVAYTASAAGGTPPYTYAWSFGDGSFSSSPSGSHTFTAVGDYQVSLTVSDSAGATGAWGPVTVDVSASNSTSNGTEPLAVGVSASTVQGPAPLNVDLTALPSGGVPPYSVSWSFGDGSAGTGLSVSHTYAAAGTYAVVATVTDSAGDLAQSAPLSIDVETSGTTNGTAPLQVAVSGDPLSGPAPLTVALTASAAGGTAPYTYVWNFGDATSGTGASVDHTFTAPGDYHVTVSVSDSAGNSASAEVLVSVVTGNDTPAHASAGGGSSAPAAISLGAGSIAGLGGALSYPILQSRPRGRAAKLEQGGRPPL